MGGSRCNRKPCSQGEADVAKRDRMERLRNTLLREAKPGVQ